MSHKSIGILVMLLFAAASAAAQPPAFEQPAGMNAPMPPGDVQAIPPISAGPGAVLGPPIINENPLPPLIQPAQPAPLDAVLPINLATALYLSNARSLVIASAQASEEEAAGRLRGSEVLWLPNLNVGTDYYRHVGIDQSSNGDIIYDRKYSFAAGAGATADFAVTDAVFRPLADRQDLASRQYDVEAARNDALLDVALAYFDVQQARGILAGLQDAADKGQVLVDKTTGLARGLVPAIEIDRAQAELSDLQQQTAVARANWRIASARLTRLLRLNPAAVVVPLEPPQLQVTLVSPQAAVGDLIPIGLTNRPELASERATAAAAAERVRQEKYRPFLPSVYVQGAGPGGYFNGGLFGGGPDGGPHPYDGRFDAELGAVWTLQNLARETGPWSASAIAQEQIAAIDFATVQDQVAREVVQAHAALEAAAVQVQRAMTAVKEAAITFQGTLKGIGQPLGGAVVIMANRPQEAVAALTQLNRAYGLYYVAVNDYNRSQFQLYRALGYPARCLVCERPLGQVAPIDTTLPALHGAGMPAAALSVIQARPPLAARRGRAMLSGDGSLRTRRASAACRRKGPGTASKTWKPASRQLRRGPAGP